MSTATRVRPSLLFFLLPFPLGVVGDLTSKHSSSRMEPKTKTKTTTGHEAPLVIVSVVRTTAPGFLKSLNRMNVMLTRCQAGMVVVTSRAFLAGPAKRTLLGKLAEHWGTLAGAASSGSGSGGDLDSGAVWVDAMWVAEGKARLPSASGRG